MTAIPLSLAHNRERDAPPPLLLPSLSLIIPSSYREGVRAMAVWRNEGTEGWNVQHCGGGEEEVVWRMDPGREPLFSLVVWIDLIQ